MGAIGISHWIIVALIVLMLFGSKRLGSLGGDVGEAIKNFRKSMRTQEADETRDAATQRAALPARDDAR